MFYTIGERHGFTINPNYKGTQDKPYYVVSKNIVENSITVSQTPQNENTSTKKLILQNIIDNQNIFKQGMKCEAQIRYRGDIKNVIIESLDDSEKVMTIIFDKEDYTLASGQSVVMYQKELCLGGGIVQ